MDILITVEDLKAMNDGEIFARGSITGEYIDGIVRYDPEGQLEYECTWIAKRGSGYHDWTFYVQPPFDLSLGFVRAKHNPRTEQQVAKIGNKIGRDMAFDILARDGVAFGVDAQKLYRS